MNIKLEQANLRRFLLGTHHKVEPRHLPRYVAELAYHLRSSLHGAGPVLALVRACLATCAIIHKDLRALPEVA
jgi:hypothetical protein